MTRAHVLLQLKVRAMRDMLFRSRIFNYLTAATPDWKLSSGDTVQWPASTQQGQGNGGVAQTVKATEGAIGYIDYSDAKASGFKFVSLKNKAGKFIDRDLYVVVYQLDGKVLAHGSNPKFVGKDMSDAQDVDGKLYVKERIEMANKQATFWQDYKFVNPVTKKVEPKQMYCERVENTAVCGGVYKL